MKREPARLRDYSFLTDDEKFRLQELRAHWEKRDRKKQGDDFGWYLSQPPEILVKLLESSEVPQGAAVDIGCGPGTSTSYIAERAFRPTVGLDIAFSALCQARKFCEEKGTRPAFVVAAAPFLPFKNESCTFLYDRGCLQALSETMWPLYLQIIAATLRTGGIFQLWVKDLSFLQLEASLPAALKSLASEQFPFELKGGRVRVISHGIFKKVSVAEE